MRRTTFFFKYPDELAVVQKGLVVGDLPLKLVKDVWERKRTWRRRNREGRWAKGRFLNEKELYALVV